MDLRELKAFVKVAELTSFTRAANQLGLAKGQVSTLVKQLEATVGTRLLQRTTRRVSLTPDGERFLDRCKELLAEADQLAATFRPAPSGLTGRLHIGLANGFARDLVLPHLPEFLSAHPRLEIGISSSDRRVELAHDSLDCALHAGAPVDPELVARPLGFLPMRNVASPAYLRAHGTPRTLADLAHHRVVHYLPSLNARGSAWEYVDAAGLRRTLAMRAHVTVNGTDAHRAAATAGLGIIQTPALNTDALVAGGELVDLLPEFRAPSLPVSLMLPNRRYIAPRVQAVTAWLAQVTAPALSPTA